MWKLLLLTNDYDMLNEHPLPPDLEKQLKDCVSLPSLPGVAVKIIEVSKDPDATLSDVASIISTDPAISAKLLKLANSPIYSQRRAVTNLREALTILGFNAALTIALSFSLFQSLNCSNAKARISVNYWRRSILSATIARLLGSRLGIVKLEELFLTGLLQDIGILVLDSLKDSTYAIEGKDSLKHSERIELEKKLLGTEHSIIGAWLLQSWKLPKTLIHAVMHSHSANEDIAEYTDMDRNFYYCLNFSGVIADLWVDETPGETMESIMEALKMFLGLDKVQFNDLLTDINEALPEISKVFEINLASEEERAHVLDEAREILLLRSVHFIKQSESDRHDIESISKQVKKVEKINQLDHLTEVYNRRHFEHLLEEEFENSNINKWPLSVALIDIDDFKNVNDTYGHLMGDEVLKSIASFFSSNLRQTDVIARYGGDEFILMLPGSTSEIAHTLLTRIFSLFEKEPGIQVENKSLVTTISIGLASHVDKNDFSDLKAFIAAADKALYKAKNKGKNCLAMY